MKKILFAILILFAFSKTYAQSGWIKPNNSYGTVSNRGAFDSVLTFPTGCGAPTRLAGYDRGNMAFYGDTCSNTLYFYSPKTKTWISVSGGAGTCDTCLVSYFLSPDSTLLYFKRVNGDTVLPALSWSGGGGGGSAKWGSIGGTLSDQTDLQSALNAKLPITDTAAMLAHYLLAVIAGKNVTVDNTNPQKPVINADSTTFNLHQPLFFNPTDTSLNFRTDSLPKLTYGVGTDTSSLAGLDLVPAKWVTDRIGAITVPTLQQAFDANPTPFPSIGTGSNAFSVIAGDFPSGTFSIMVVAPGSIAYKTGTGTDYTGFIFDSLFAHIFSQTTNGSNPGILLGNDDADGNYINGYVSLAVPPLFTHPDSIAVFDVDSVKKVGINQLFIDSTVTLSSGTITVSDPRVKTGAKIFISVNTPSGTQGFLSAKTSDIVDGTSFIINSTSATETSTINYEIINP
jgi:hypothetical protein